MLFAASHSGLASASVLSLKEAVRFALEHAPTLDAAVKARAISELRYKNAFAKLLPSADFATTNGLQNNIPIASPAGTNSLFAPNSTAPWFSSLNLGATETLYDNGVSITNLGIADLNRDLASVNYRKARDKLVLDIVSEFYRYSLSMALLGVRRQQQAILDKQFRTLKSQYQQGFKPKSDFLRLKIQVQQSEVDLIAATNAMIQSMGSLRNLIGVHYHSSELPDFEPILVKAMPETVFPEKAPPLEETYDYRSMQIQKELNQKNVTLAKRDYWPRVSLTSGISYSNQDYLNSSAHFAEGHRLSWNALMTLQYNLWDGGTRRRDIEIAEYNRDIQEDSTQQSLLGINAAIRSLMAEISKTKQSYKLSQELIGLQETSHRDLEMQYREGKATYLDLAASLNGLLSARIQFNTFYFDALTSIAQYQYYAGRLYETIVEK